MTTTTKIEEPQADTTIPRYPDRAGWGAGPWDGEADRYEWRHLGFACLIVRGPAGALCGYVGVSPSHPWHGASYHALSGYARDDDEPVIADVDVHGGLTYAAECSGHICHVPRAGEPAELWWVGFDCNHSGDFAPAMTLRFGDMGEYQALAYVTGQVRSLAEQALAALDAAPDPR